MNMDNFKPITWKELVSLIEESRACIIDTMNYSIPFVSGRGTIEGWIPDKTVCLIDEDTFGPDKKSINFTWIEQHVYKKGIWHSIVQFDSETCNLYIDTNGLILVKSHDGTKTMLTLLKD